jgi:hypothetical protein
LELLLILAGIVAFAFVATGALHKAQNAMEGVAEKLGLRDGDDVQKLVDEVRYGERRA